MPHNNNILLLLHLHKALSGHIALRRFMRSETPAGVQGMFSTLQQVSEAVRSRGEATASGDRWIEDAWSKGKAVNVPQLAGHRDFADVLQQTYANPYK